MHKTTNNENQTINFARTFAKKLKGGEVLLLIGDLGAGKTTFVKGLAQGFKIKRHITSPTFVIMKVYKVTEHGSWNTKNKTMNQPINQLVHIDTYRGLDINDLENIGTLEYFGKKDTVCVVEWGEGLASYLKKKKIKYYKITIETIDIKKRLFRVNP